MEDETPSQGTEETGQTFRQLIESVNIAENLSEEELHKIGSDCKRAFDADVLSRVDWEKQYDHWLKLAKQIQEERNFPWQGASNVKYPLMTTAAMQFSARAYPSLVPSSGNIVKSKVIGKDPDGSKLALSERVSTYMSYQILHEMDGWEEDMDKLLMQVSVSGMMFKKTYWDSVKQVPKSLIVSPKNLVVNYWTKNLRESERISEIIEMSPRVLEERKRAGLFLKVDLGDAPLPEGSNGAFADDTTPYTLIEQHTFLDLDDDGYKEPYVVTFHKETAKVLRITARFDEESIVFSDDGKEVVKIDPIHYYTKFGFIPNPDGSFYDIGFGCLLGPINESVNTLINQLIDSGTLNNLQSGFLGKGLRLRMGDYGFRPGEWKTVNAVGDDLKKQIVPLPSKEPSAVLFQLMGSLITSGKELASVAEIFTGKMPGQNTPATTTMATIEQGMKVFTAVYKRIYRSLEEEFQKIYDLNGVYLNTNSYAEIMDVQVGPEDFKTKYDICPGADPSASSQTEKLTKAQGLMELLPTGILDPVEVVRRVLEAQEQPNFEKLFSQQIQQTGQFQPPPDPKLQEMEMKGQLEQQKMAAQLQMQQHKGELEARDKQVQLAMKAQEHALDMQHKERMGKLQAAEAVHKQRIFSVQAQADLNQKLMQGSQTLAQKDAEHRQKLKQKPKEGNSNK